MLVGWVVAQGAFACSVSSTTSNGVEPAEVSRLGDAPSGVFEPADDAYVDAANLTDVAIWTDVADAPVESAAADSSTPLDGDAADSVDPEEAGLADSGDATAPLSPTYFDPAVNDDDVFAHANPDAVGVNMPALDALLAEAQAQSTDAMILAIGDTIVLERYFAGKRSAVPLQSVSKSVVSLAVGILIDEGKIASTTVPVSTYFPEWATGAKASVTIGHLLSMTSGMTDDANGGFFAATDRLAYARARTLTGALGTFSYSDTAAMLFSGIIAIASGMQMDAFINDRIWSKIGVADASWATDGAGNVVAPSGLYLSPRSMLRLARLLRDGGSWKGASVVGPSWLNTSATQASAGSLCYAYLWWLSRTGCSSATPLVTAPGPITGTFAAGWGGNYIATVSGKTTIGIRTKDAATATYDAMKITAFESFPAMLVGLTP